NVFIVLTTFVGFTTSVFSASYIGHELETGRLTPTNLRFYHAMYQTLMFAMNLALVANNIGLMWVAVELATLTTVLMVGTYRTQVGLAPLHAWLPDAHAEGPTPISAVLSGLLLNVALYALLRFKLLLAANPNALAPGPLMVIIGLVSLIFAAFMLYRRRDIKRMFAYSSIEHMGIITFAFGIGGPLANFAGLLHMTMHSL